MVVDALDFKKNADSMFEILLTITTILSGTYTAITFNWFSQYMVTPTDPRMIELATSGNILGLMFILPLVIVIVGWALSKLRDSIKWRVISWAGLIYCLTQDFIGIIALFTASLIISQLVHHTITDIALPFVLLIPPFVATVLGYSVSKGYSRTMEMPIKRRGLVGAVLTGIALILIIQIFLGVLLLYLGAIFP